MSNEMSPPLPPITNSVSNLSGSRPECSMLELALDEAMQGVARGEGGPFGAVIVNTKTGKIIARSHNMVLQTNDPTAHAEVTCIRLASARLGRHDLSDCTLYSSCEPCPMCFGAIHWARLRQCTYASLAEDASQAGFDDGFIYRAIRHELRPGELPHCRFVHQPVSGAEDVFKAEYQRY